MFSNSGQKGVNSDKKIFEPKQESDFVLDDKVSGNLGQNSAYNKSKNTLVSLTKRFITIIRGSPSKTIEIERASIDLGIPKRRIYDITNVLEGIGYIVKLQKNQMQWVGGIQFEQLERQSEVLTQKLLKIDQQSQQLQRRIDKVKKDMMELSLRNTKFNYFRNRDITKMMKNLDIHNLLIYAGSVGDIVQNDSNPEISNNRCTIYSKQRSSLITYFKLKQNYKPITAKVKKARAAPAREISQEKQVAAREIPQEDLFLEDLFNELNSDSSGQNLVSKTFL